jgi:hypothetical protein
MIDWSYYIYTEHDYIDLDLIEHTFEKLINTVYNITRITNETVIEYVCMTDVCDVQLFPFNVFIWAKPYRKITTINKNKQQHISYHEIDIEKIDAKKYPMLYNLVDITTNFDKNELMNKLIDTKHVAICDIIQTCRYNESIAEFFYNTLSGIQQLQQSFDIINECNNEKLDGDSTVNIKKLINDYNGGIFNKPKLEKTTNITSTPSQKQGYYQQMYKTMLENTETIRCKSMRKRLYHQWLYKTITNTEQFGYEKSK